MKFSDLARGASQDGEPEEETVDPAVYRGIVFARNRRPCMGVSLVLKNGSRRLFWYHGIEPPAYDVIDCEELLSFDYGIFVIFMSVTNLEQVYDRLQEHSLKVIQEYDGRPAAEGTPVISRLSISIAKREKMIAPKIELVTPAKAL